jgi:hypothetical protein
MPQPPPSLAEEPHLKVKVLLEGKQLSWADLKQKYLHDPERYKFAIKQANWLRTSLVNGLLQNVLVEMDATKNTTYRADGSTDLTSDYDVSLEGAKKEDVAIAFNAMFEDMFGRPSAEILDSNLYASGPISEAHDPRSTECRGHFSCTSACMKKTDRCFLIAQLRFRNSSAVVANQHSWALATILRNLLPEEIEKMKSMIMTGHHKRLKTLFKQAVVLFETNPISDDIHKANLQYGEMLHDIYNIRTEGTTSQSEQEYALKFANAESRGGWYAQEAYSTVGAFLHVVGNDQRKLDLAISADEYKDSFIENMAYVMHALTPGVSCSKSFVVAAKYIARAAFAASQVFDTTEHEIVQQMESLMRESVQVRAQREELLKRALTESVEQPMLAHMKGVSCKDATSRMQVLEWIVSFLDLMF